eukprot:10346878-Lingulodinium_polyedra.AAC.1
MGATRAVVTIRQVSGQMVYVNDMGLARDLMKELISAGHAGAPPLGPDSVSQRLGACEAAMRVQQELAVE